ncbi:MAG: FHA domain-containing protein, partial [Bdellovibrionales bacterium]|nr:FHA domain-containing protein [Oligoflexia bacterium]
MKLLTLSMNRLELARLQLRKPLIVVGRSPTCDVVLRAQDIKPIHFIIEWIGNGKFNPKAGQWSIVDVSNNAEAGEGLVLGTNPLIIDDISFVCIESGIESTEVIGGKIIEGLSTNEAHVPDLLEFVQVRNDSGSIEEVRHIALPRTAKAQSLSKEFKAFKVEKSTLNTEHLLNVILDELPGAELLLSGRKIDPTSRVPLGANDFLQVKWNGRNFYLRFVEEVQSPPIPRDFWGDPLLKKLTAGVALFLLALFLIHAIIPKPIAEEIPPVRVARVEVPAPPKPVIKEPEAKPVVEEQKPAKVESLIKVKKVVTAPAKAAAPKVVSAPKEKPRAGLNIKAPVANVNTIGILGALHKNVDKGQGIRADKIINNGLIQQAVTGKEETRIVITNPPAGVIG